MLGSIKAENKRAEEPAIKTTLEMHDEVDGSVACVWLALAKYSCCISL